MSGLEPIGRVWVLNLDAESELAATRSYAPTEQLRQIVARERQRLIGTLTGPRDVVLDEQLLERRGPELERVRGWPGFAWCPTPRALAMLRSAGAVPMQVPPLEQLRSVNARPFGAALRAEHAPGSFVKHCVSDLEAALVLLALPAERGWLVRREFGAAGRGRRRLHSGKPSSDECSWLQASLRMGPLTIEPWVEIVREYTRSAWVRADGTISISEPCAQTTTEHGAWLETQRVDGSSISSADDQALQAMTERVGRALHARGYRGPFGIDAWRHRVPGSLATALNPLSEINARFTMDWATAMARDPRSGVALSELAQLTGAPVVEGGP